MSDELIRLSASRVADLLRAKAIRPSDLVKAAAARIEAVDGRLNALPVRCFERARAQARSLEEAGDAGKLLGGIPIVVKDNNDVGGVGTSGGTPIFRDRVAVSSDRTIALLEARGAIPVAKANLSELGGANTTNRVFGATRHPYDLALTCGGSSGGSAVAVATGQVWLAHGNDVGGSLRIPPAFCGVVGLRPTPGRVVRKELCDPFDTVMVDGPIARSVEDVALMFDAMVGFDARDPLSSPSPDGPFRGAGRSPARPGGCVAFSASPGGLPVDAEIAAVCERAVQRLAAGGLHVVADEPATEGLRDTVLALRGDAYARSWEPLLDAHRGDFTPEVLADIERGLRQPPAALRAALRHRADLQRGVTDFLQRHDFFLCPATQAMPFPVETRWPTDIGGVRLTDYVDWILIDYAWSLVACPVLALPVGRSASGLPVGLQVMGPPRSEAALLRFGAWIERELATPTAPVDPPLSPERAAPATNGP
ncbi:amidase [Variovorax sp. KK3]|uniref:amidase n=1 Tax=Variovorax sp. KK3 TaxID=1855728 RepID=UPI0015C3B703|nr:amidase [Variovorax sp. KK3]